MGRKHTRLVHEGDLAAEVEVGLLDSEDGWAPNLSVADARRLDNVREALRTGDVTSAAKHARLYRMVPVSA